MNLSGKRTPGLKNPGKAYCAEGANPNWVNLSGKRQGRQIYFCLLLNLNQYWRKK